MPLQKRGVASNHTPVSWAYLALTPWLAISHYNRELGNLRGVVASRESGRGYTRRAWSALRCQKGRTWSHTHRTPTMKTYQPDARVHRKNTQWPAVEQFEQENVILGYDPNYKTNAHNPYWKQQQQPKNKNPLWVNDMGYRQTAGQEHPKSLS